MATVSDRLAEESLRVTAVIRDLRQELEAIAESTAAGPDDEHDTEGSTVGYERARVQALLDHAQRRAAEIADATRRGDGPSSGMPRCAHCGGSIPEERQLALPTTRVCVTCAARA